MSVNKNNNIFEKTSFLGNNSSEFVENLYADYLNNPQKLPEEWKLFFEGLNDKKEKILKNVNGPSWSPRKKIIKKYSIKDENLTQDTENIKTSTDNQDLLEAAKNSVRANMLVRAYRIRGHLISNLDPLELQLRQEHPELKPETYGFSEKDLNKNIFLDGVLGLQSANLKEIIEKKLVMSSCIWATQMKNNGLGIELKVKKKELILQRMEKKQY